MRRAHYIIFAALAAAITAGCSSTPDEKSSESVAVRKAPTTEVPLSTVRVSSTDEALSVQLPEGWTRVVPDESGEAILLWLTNPDYTASITFMPIQMDPALYQALKRDGLPAVSKVSMSLKEGNIDAPMEIVQAPEPFELGGRKFYSYEYSIDHRATIVRIVLFDTGTRFLECACVPGAGQTTPAVQRELFRSQQAVLSSLELR